MANPVPKTPAERETARQLAYLAGLGVVSIGMGVWTLVKGKRR